MLLSFIAGLLISSLWYYIGYRHGETRGYEISFTDAMLSKMAKDYAEMKQQITKGETND